MRHDIHARALLCHQLPQQSSSSYSGPPEISGKDSRIPRPNPRPIDKLFWNATIYDEEYGLFIMNRQLATLAGYKST